jgi:hypothetical protein
MAKRGLTSALYPREAWPARHKKREFTLYSPVLSGKMSRDGFAHNCPHHH